MKSRKSDRDGLTRRQAMIRAAALTMAATGVCPPGYLFASNPTTRTPGEEEGPFYLDLNLDRSDLRANTATATSNPGVVQAGFKLLLSLSVSKLTGTLVTPVSGAKVDIWLCNGNGLYSGENQSAHAGLSGNTVGQNYLRGYQVTNAHGSVSFILNYPGWYSGRTPHCHFKVKQYAAGANVTTATPTYTLTSQLFFNEAVTAAVFKTAPYSIWGNQDVYQAQDHVFTGASQGNGATVASEVGQYTLTRLAKNATQANASFNIVL